MLDARDQCSEVFANDLLAVFAGPDKALFRNRTDFPKGHFQAQLRPRWHDVRRGQRLAQTLEAGQVRLIREVF